MDVHSGSRIHGNFHISRTDGCKCVIFVEVAIEKTLTELLAASIILLSRQGCLLSLGARPRPVSVLFSIF